MATGHQPGLGRRVQQARLALGLAQSDLAGADVSASYVSLIETGKREPTAAVLAQLALRLHVEADYLRTGVGVVDATQVRMDLAFAKVALHEGRAAEALALLTSLVGQPAVAALGEAVEFDVVMTLAAAHERVGDTRSAVAVLERLRLRAEGSTGALPWLPVMVALCRCYRDAGDVGRAIDLAEAALVKCEGFGLVGIDAHTQLVSTLAGVYGDRGDLLRASNLLDELLLSFDEDSGNQQRGYAYWNAAMTAVERGEPGEALRLMERAVALIADGDDERNQARIKVARAWIMLEQETPDAHSARGLLREALPSLRRSAGVDAVASAHTELSRAELLLGRPEVAVRHANKALALHNGNYPLSVARAHTALGLARLAADATDATDTGLASLRTATEVLAQVDAPRQAAALWRQLAAAHRSLGDTDTAVQYLERALDAIGIADARPPASTARTKPKRATRETPVR